MRIIKLRVMLASLLPITLPATAAQTDILSIEHYVANESKAPSMAGAMAQIYVRERVASDVASANQWYFSSMALAHQRK